MASKTGSKGSKGSQGQRPTLAQARANMAANPSVPAVPADWKPAERSVGNGRQFRSLNTRPEFFTFDKAGDALEGRLIGLRDVTTQFGPGRVADLTTDGGQQVACFISAGMSALDNRNLIGAYVRVEYLGKKENPNTGRTFKSFDVQVSAEDYSADVEAADGEGSHENPF